MHESMFHHFSHPVQNFYIPNSISGIPKVPIHAPCFGPQIFSPGPFPGPEPTSCPVAFLSSSFTFLGRPWNFKNMLVTGGDSHGFTYGQQCAFHVSTAANELESLGERLRVTIQYTIAYPDKYSNTPQ